MTTTARAVDSVDTGEGPYPEFRRELVDRYREAYDGSTKTMEVSPEKVADVIVSAATSAHPRARYAVGTMAKTLITSRRLLPAVAWDRVVRSVWPTPHPPES